MSPRDRGAEHFPAEAPPPAPVVSGGGQAAHGRRPSRGSLALLALLVLVVVLPRIYAVWGMQYTSNLFFEDMNVHLLNIDVLWKRGKLAKPRPQHGMYSSELPTAIREQTRWPWGVYRVGQLFAPLFGPYSIWTVQLTNWIFLLVMLAGVLLLGQAAGGIRLGLWAAILTALCPPLLGSSWYMSLDFPLAAMTPVGLYLLLRSEGFRSTRYSLGLGLWSALGLYVKMTYAIYLLLPSLWAAGSGLLRRGRRARAAANLGLALAVVVGISLLLDNFNLAEIYLQLTSHMELDYQVPADAVTRIERWSLYGVLTPARFAWLAYPWPLLLLALPGLYLLHRPGRELRSRWLWLCALWGGYLGLAFLDAKMHRYNLPLYPVVCLVTVVGLRGLLPRRWRPVPLLLAAGLYVTMVVLVHLITVPWGDAGPSLSSSPMHFDLRPPTRAEISGLRGAGLHPRCEVLPLVHEMARMVRGVGGLEPVVVTHSLAPKEDLFPGSGINRDGVSAWLAQFLPQRFVITKPFELPPRAELEALGNYPTMVILHRPGYRPLAVHPDLPLRLEGIRRQWLHCPGLDDRWYPAAISVIGAPEPEASGR